MSESSQGSSFPPRDDFAAWYEAKQKALLKARADGVIDWYDALSIVQETEQQPFSRHTMEIVFTFRPSSRWHDSWSGAKAQREAEAEVADALREADVAGIDYRAVVTTAGRGASWATVALVLGGAAAAVPQVINCWFDLARNASGVWRGLRSSKRAAQVSRGALVALCVEDLRTRTGSNLEGVVLVSATDLGQRDVTHSGSGDLVSVIFADQGHTWLYLVDTDGRLIDVHVIGRLRNGVALFSGLSMQEPEPEYHLLLDEKSDESVGE